MLLGWRSKEVLPSSEFLSFVPLIPTFPFGGFRHWFFVHFHPARSRTWQEKGKGRVRQLGPFQIDLPLSGPPATPSQSHFFRNVLIIDNVLEIS